MASRTESVPTRSGGFAFIVGKSMTYLTSIAIANIFAVLLFLVAVQAFRDRRRRGGLPYPPGPRPLPIIGNLLDVPKHFSWLAYTKFSKIHGNGSSLGGRSPFLTRTTGDILSFHVLGQSVVVLNSVKATKDLFEKRGAIYSDRSMMPIYDMWVLLSYIFGVSAHVNQNGVELGSDICQKRRPLAYRTQDA